jgi:hypothetical protein
LSEYPRGSAPSFTADQIDAMNRAFADGVDGLHPLSSCDPDKMAETVVAEFGA